MRLRILYPKLRDLGYESAFTIAPTISWDATERSGLSRHSSWRSGCSFQWETTVPELDESENEFFEFLSANADRLRERPSGCNVYVEYYCYMAEPRFLVQLSAERVSLIASFGGELCVETY